MCVAQDAPMARCDAGGSMTGPRRCNCRMGIFDTKRPAGIECDTNGRSTATGNLYELRRSRTSRSRSTSTYRNATRLTTLSGREG